MTDQAPKAPGIPEAIASAIVPAKIAAALDASPHWSDHWRSAFRFISTYADLTTLSSLTVAGVAAYNAEKALGTTLGLPIWVSIALGAVAVVVSFIAKFRTQNLPPPPPSALPGKYPSDPSDSAGA